MMWIDLLLTILCTAALFALFRVFERLQIPSAPAIVINYAVAGGLGLMLVGGGEVWAKASQHAWFYVAPLAGTGFLYIFRLVARSAQTIGMAPTSVASKLSMVIPVGIFLLTDPTDVLTWQKACAMALALPAVVLAAWTPGMRLEIHHFRLPLTIFVGGGLIDLLFAWYSGPEHMVEPEFRYLFATLPFLSAAITGAWVLWREARPQRASFDASTLASPPEKAPWHHTLLGGLVLGIVNFGSLYFLLESYATLQGDMPRSSIIPVTNLGVVILSAVSGVVAFRERLSARNAWGLLLGCAAIALLLA
jgi:hypothetical protein